MYLINAEDVEKESINQGISREELKVPTSIFLTFNKCIIDEFSRICGLREWEWQGVNLSPAYLPMFTKGWKGSCKGNDVAVFIPPMGASTLVSFCEELIHYGAKIIFLLCASWGFGGKCLKQGQIHLPDFAVGVDGTSPHYGNSRKRAMAEPRAFKALRDSLDSLDADWKEGGVGTCEAFYRITQEMVDDFRKQGCLSMENGETMALYCLADEYSIPIGVLLQPYIDLEKGWEISYMGDKYKETGKIQALAAIGASKILL
jgi:uridine phosphorylase